MGALLLGMFLSMSVYVSTPQSFLKWAPLVESLTVSKTNGSRCFEVFHSPNELDFRKVVFFFDGICLEFLNGSPEDVLVSPSRALRFASGHSTRDLTKQKDVFLLGDGYRWLKAEKYPKYPSPYSMGVSKNRGTPKSSILTGCSIMNHPFWGPTPIFGSTSIYGPSILVSFKW